MRFYVNVPHSFFQTGLKSAKNINWVSVGILEMFSDLKIKATDLKFSIKITYKSYV